MDIIIDNIIEILHHYFPIGDDSEAMIEYINCAEEILELIKLKQNKEEGEIK